MTTVFFGLGSNLGDKKKNISSAISELEQFVEITHLSPFYKTEPVGFANQDWFVNCCVGASTKEPPQAALEKIKSIEKKLGREPTVANGPRIIDIDILLYDSVVLNSDPLTLPHPRMHERAFVLKPLADIAPDVIHPIQKKSIKELLEKLQKKEKVELL